VYQQTGTSSFEKAYFYQVEKQEQKTYKIGEVINTGTFEITAISADQKTVVGGQYVNEKAF
jgi:hypothetical protein